MPPAKRQPRQYGRKPTGSELQFDEEVTPLPVDVDEAVSRLWEIRNVGEKVAALDATMQGYTAQTDRLQAEMTQWSGAVKDCIAATDAASDRLVVIQANLSSFFEREWPRLSKALDGFADSIRELGNRMTKLESLVSHVGEAQESQAAKLVALESKVNALELDHRDKRVAAATTRQIFSWARAGVVALAAIGGFVAQHIIEWIK